MPQQLIYTSAPRGIVAGRSGHCTVARSAAMREALALRLEQLSYYQHLFLGGAGEQPIFAHRIIDIRGARFHVLSRIQDAGLDFTGRTNFIAHHLAVTLEERGALPTPPVILRDWPGWVKQWAGEPQLLESEDWASLSALAAVTSLPAQTWKKVSGDAVNGYGLLELGAGTVLRVNGQPDAIVLGLMAESLELLEVRDIRHDWRSAAWQFTFTTSLQEQDNPGDFRWRCVQGEIPPRLGAADSRALIALTANPCTEEEAALARTGRQPPQFVLEPQNIQISEGEDARFQAKAAGVPNPGYQWFKVDRENNGQPVAGAIHPELVISHPPRGLSRYVLRIQNSAGEVMSRTVVLSVELKSAIIDPMAGAGWQAAEKERHQKSAEEIEQQRHRLEAEEREARRNRRLYGKPILLIVLFLGILAATVAGWVVMRQGRGERGGVLRNGTDETDRTDRTNKTDGAYATNRIQPMEANRAIPAAPVPPATPVLAQPPVSNGIRHPALEGSFTEAPGKSNFEEKKGNIMARAENFNVPPGWTAKCIGAVWKTNSEYFPDEHPHREDLSAACAGFDGAGDNVLFIYTNSPKHFSAAIVHIESSTPDSGCGIMVRQSTATDSPFLFLGASSDKLLVYLRDTDGHFYSDSTQRPPEPMRLTIWENDGRYEQVCSFGQNYSQSFRFAPIYSVQLKDPSLIGFALASGSSSNVVTAHFAMVDQNSRGQANSE